MPDARFQGFARRLQPSPTWNIGSSGSSFFDGCPSQQEQGFGPISGVIGNHLQETCKSKNVGTNDDLVTVHT